MRPVPTAWRSSPLGLPQVRPMRAVTGETAQNARMQVLQTQYTNQFTALNTLLSQLQATSSYLTQALARISHR